MNDREIALILVSSAAILAAVLSWVAAFATRRLAWKYGALSYPGGRREHAVAMPQWGGLGICLVVIALIGLAGGLGWLEQTRLEPLQITGFLVGLVILLIGGLIDDRKELPAHIQILFPLAAAFVVLETGTTIAQVTQPLGHGGLSLVWWSRDLVSWWPGVSQFPADLITLAWIVVATYTTKILDGLDGLVTGLTVIGAGLVGALSLSSAYFQPAVALISGIVGGAFLGFLPHNRHPAKQYLAEAGSLIAGFSLAVLAILSTAKIAIALAVLALPIMDLILVALGRIRRGVPWYRGDRSHLHFKLLAAGLPYRLAVLLMWLIALSAGIVALTLQTKGKIFLILGLFILAVVASYVAGFYARRNRR
jgi:UDP-GlcNAc:undecaprenyl-phosphate GlcNAc-1-phosphate transferase